MKQCTKCKQNKPATLEHFPRNNKMTSGLDSWCLECRRARARQRQAARRADPVEREKVLAEKRRYQQSPAGRARKRRVSQIENQKRRQQGTDAVWDWSVQDWEDTKAMWGHECAYCGTQPSELEHDHFIPISHPDFTGTHPGNIVPVCSECNLRKAKAHPRDFLSPERYALVAVWLQSNGRPLSG